jgi:uridine kinase
MMTERYYQSIVNELSRNINQQLQDQPRLLIGIDGCGGSGKTQLASELLDALHDAQVVHMDDFHLPSAKRFSMADPKLVGWQFDWKRLEREVLAPLESGQQARYQRYDWPTDDLAEWHEFQSSGAVIIEGIFALRKELSGYYDLRLWVDCPRDVRLQRGLMRDGEAARSQWENDWMKEEDRYVAEHLPHRRAHRIISGFPVRSDHTAD